MHVPIVLILSDYRENLLPQKLLSGLERLELAHVSRLNADVPLLHRCQHVPSNNQSN